MYLSNHFCLFLASIFQINIMFICVIFSQEAVVQIGR